MKMSFENSPAKKLDPFTLKGYLGVTAEDHESLGSTPEQRLIENPGKSLGEIMSDNEIVKNISEQLEFFKQQDIQEDDRESWLDFIKQRKEDFITSMRYLKSINRLPENIDIDYLEGVLS